MLRRALNNAASIRAYTVQVKSLSNGRLIAGTNAMYKQDGFKNQTAGQMNAQVMNARLLHTNTLCLAAHQPFSMKTVRERILLVLSLYDKIDAEKLTLDSNFFTDLGLDSLDFVELIMALEDEFQFEIPDGDMDRIKTPRDIYQYICDKEDIYD